MVSYKKYWNSAQVSDSVAKPVASDTVEPDASGAGAQEIARLEAILKETTTALAELKNKTSFEKPGDTSVKQAI